MQKRLMILGGSEYVIPVIKTAQAAGHYVITCDYLPDNVAHKHSDEYINVSIVDIDAVLQVARASKIDGIMSFAADPGVLTAAHIAEEMDLPFQGSRDAVTILQNKDRFRAFLAAHNFNAPKAFIFDSVVAAKEALRELPYPVIVKPTDSAGSKGVRRVDAPAELEQAVDYALSFSPSGHCIVEEFITALGETSDSDCFMSDGEFVCISFTAQYFNANRNNSYVPSSYLMPSSMAHSHQEELRSELQRLATLLGLQSGIFNIETRVDTEGRTFIMEVSPRGGGNRLAEMLKESSGVDLIAASVAAALGEVAPQVVMPDHLGYLHQEILNSDRPGSFDGLEIPVDFENNHVIDKKIWTELGSPVAEFSAANFALGSVFLKFETAAQLEEFRRDKEVYLRVVIGE